MAESSRAAGPSSGGSSGAAQDGGDAAMALRTFELNNAMITLDPSDDIFRYDYDDQRRINNERPWKKDPHYFKRVRISAIALIKMVMHARSGGIYEIMGLMQGKIDDKTQTFYVMDAFALPVEGTETRVNAGNEAFEFMVQYGEASKSVERLENAVGWYHSHPGYGCWLSGIDVSTQSTNQQYQDPFVAIVIDPNRTISAGKVDIGAFRTYPPDYTPPATDESEYQSIPLNKIEDFGVHAGQYYSLEVEVFKSSLDETLLNLLWNKYWISTLSQSSLIVNRSYTASQVRDLAQKISNMQSKVRNGRSGTVAQGASLDLRIDETFRKGGGGKESTSSKGKGSASADGPDHHPKIQAAMEELAKRDGSRPLAQAVRDAQKIASEAKAGLISQVLKDMVFNQGRAQINMPPVA